MAHFTSFPTTLQGGGFPLETGDAKWLMRSLSRLWETISIAIYMVMQTIIREWVAQKAQKCLNFHKSKK